MHFQGSEKPGFLETQPTGFLVFVGFWALFGLGFFYLNEQLGRSPIINSLYLEMLSVN